MKFKSYCIVTLLIFITVACFSDTLSAQDFFKDYGKFLWKNSYRHNHRTKRDIDSSIFRLEKTISQFEFEHHQSFFTSDSVYIVNFLAAETHLPSTLIWNNHNSCYFAYSFESRNWKIVSQTTEIKTDASAIVNELSPHFKALIVTGDTSGYHRFADSNRVYDGEWVSPVICIRKNDHWLFTAFNGDGWAVDVFDSIHREER